MINLRTTGKNLFLSIIVINLRTTGKNLFLSIAKLTDFIFENLWANDASNLVGKLQSLSQLATLQHNQTLSNTEISYGSKSLFATQQVALLSQIFSTCLVTLEGSSHLLVLQPLVADELQFIVTLGCLQILVGGLDETVSQIVLLLQRGVSQGGVDGRLRQVGALLTTKGGIQFFG